MPLSLRPLHPRDPHEHHRVSTTLELFFDLISVIAISAVTAGLHHAISAGHGLQALPAFIFLFLTIWWAWMNFTWFASAFDNDDWLYRVIIMVIMCGELIFAGGAGFIMETLNFHFGIVGWILMRFGMIALWLRVAAGNQEYRTTAHRYALGIVVAQCGWTLFYFFATPGSQGYFLAAALCFAVELSVAPFAERAHPSPFHRHHIIERYGLLMIITLGEIVLSIAGGFGALYSDHPAYGAGLVSVSALVIVFSTWWVYFCEAEPLPSTRTWPAFLWGYGHVMVFMATAMMGASVAASIDVATAHADATQSDVSHWLGGSIALGCFALWVVRDRVIGLAAGLGYVLPVMALAFALAGWAGLPVWVFALISVATVLWRAPQIPVSHGQG